MKRALYFDSMILAVGNLQKAACTAIRFRRILISVPHIKKQWFIHELFNPKAACTL